MSDNARIVKLLNDLLAAEQRSVLPRVVEAAPFVKSDASAIAESIGRMVREESEHAEWLIESILAHGGSPAPTVADLTTCNFHYLELQYLLPRAVQSKEATLDAYEAAFMQIAEGEVRSLLARIIDRHHGHLKELNAFVSGGCAA